ncbi:MAG: alpha/beta fold hydrolase, partial [Chloroflexi bacterium]|nr:alpha/beta fold hydrolase [Chloroflexota bacterium]
MDPEIRYVRSADGTRIATAAMGSGPPLLMPMPNAIGTIEMSLAIPDWRASMERLAQRFTFITYDPRGQGLSDRDADDLSLESRVADLHAVVQAMSLGSINILARGLTGPVAITYAARYPTHVSR